MPTAVRRVLIAVALAWVAPSSPAAAVETTSRPADVVRPAMQLLAEECYSCHNPRKTKGGLLLTTREAALQGGDDGEVLLPGKAADSAIFSNLSPDADSHMPPKRQLTAAQMEIVRRWIDAGAAWDEKLLAARAAAQAPATRPVALRPLPANYRPAMALAVSPDQKRLAAVRGDAILLYDLSKKERPVLAELRTPSDIAQSLAWSPDGHWLASGGFRAVRLWDGGSTAPARTFSGAAGRVTALAWADVATLLAGEGEPAFPGIVHVWKLDHPEQTSQWPAHTDAVLAMHIGNAGKLLVTAGADKLVKTWSLPDGKEVGKFEGHVAQVMAVCLSPDGTKLASAGADREIKVWETKTREQSVSFPPLPGGVTGLTWLDDKMLLCSCEDGVARLYNIANKDRVERTFAGAPDVLYAVVVTKESIFAACHDGSVYEWQSASAKLLGKLPIQP